MKEVQSRRIPNLVLASSFLFANIPFNPVFAANDIRELSATESQTLAPPSSLSGGNLPAETAIDAMRRSVFHLSRLDRVEESVLLKQGDYVRAELLRTYGSLPAAARGLYQGYIAKRRVLEVKEAGGDWEQFAHQNDALLEFLRESRHLDMLSLYEQIEEVYLDKVKEFVEKRIAPRAYEIDVLDVVPLEIYQEMVYEGLVGTQFKQIDGGVGLSSKAWLRVNFMVSEVSSGVTLGALNVWGSLGPDPLEKHLDNPRAEVQRRDVMVKLLHGEAIVVFSLTEANAGSDNANMKTEIRDGRLNGSKMFITVGMVLPADYEDILGLPETITSMTQVADELKNHWVRLGVDLALWNALRRQVAENVKRYKPMEHWQVIAARTKPRDPDKPHRDIGAVLTKTKESGVLPTREGNKSENLVFGPHVMGKKEPVMGHRGSGTTAFFYDGLPIDLERDLIGTLKDFLITLSRGRFTISAHSIGVIRGLRTAVERALSIRLDTQGWSDIPGNKDIRVAVEALITEMTVLDNLYTELLEQGAERKDAGEEIMFPAALAKILAPTASTDLAVRVGEALLSMGYSANSVIPGLTGPVAQPTRYADMRLRDVKLLEIGEGTTQIQEVKIVVPQLLREPETPEYSSELAMLREDAKKLRIAGAIADVMDIRNLALPLYRKNNHTSIAALENEEPVALTDVVFKELPELEGRVHVLLAGYRRYKNDLNAGTGQSAQGWLNWYIRDTFRWMQTKAFYNFPRGDVEAMHKAVALVQKEWFFITEIDALARDARDHGKIFPEAYENLQKWLHPSYKDAHPRIWEILERGDFKDFNDRFFKVAEPGTAGIRGTLGIGSALISGYNLGEYVEAHARYISSPEYLSMIPGRAEGDPLVVVIAYDSREGSYDPGHGGPAYLVKQAARIFAAHGIKVIIADRPTPTPMLSFMVRELEGVNPIAGAVFTASHNPKTDNGFKPYQFDGAQLVEPHSGALKAAAASIRSFGEVQLIDYDEALEDGLIEVVDTEKVIFPQYLAKQLTQGVHVLADGTFDPAFVDVSDLSVAFSALHGTSYEIVRELAKARELDMEKFYVVESQKDPDGRFPTLKKPNPEEPEALVELEKLAKEKDVDIAMATDPDADRLGVLIKDDQGGYAILTGNQQLAVVTHYMLSQLKKLGKLRDGAAITKTIVSSDFARVIARSFGLDVIEMHVGFKYIGELLQYYETEVCKMAGLSPQEYKAKTLEERRGLASQYARLLLLGGEESYGANTGDFVRDKDGPRMVDQFIEIAGFYRKEGRTIYEVLQEMYQTYGYFKEDMLSLEYPGAEGGQKMKRVMDYFEGQALETIAGKRVLAKLDYDKRVAWDGAGQELFDSSLKGDYAREGVEFAGFQTIDSHILPREKVIGFILEDGSKVYVRPSGTEPKIKVYVLARGDFADSAATTEKVSVIKKELEVQATLVAQGKRDTEAGEVVSEDVGTYGRLGRPEALTLESPGALGFSL